MAVLPALEWAGAVPLAVWTVLAFGRGGFWRLREEQSVPPAPLIAKSVTVLIPARNEADVIGATVASLRAQGAVEIYVVDDSSTDGTATVAQAAGAHVISAPPLAPGWTGKLWALHHGVEAVPASDYLLFTDADIVHGPDSVASLVARAERDHLDLVSYMVLLHCRTLAERALIPAFVFFFFMLYPPAWIANPTRKMAGAAGGCILIRPEMLAHIGGIAALRGALIDDCTLARLVKSQGGRLWLGVTQQTRSSRAYETFGEIERMIARTAFTQLQFSSLLLTGTVLGMLLVYVLPVGLALAGYWTGWLTLALMYVLFLPTVLFYRQNPLWAAALPFIALFYLAATLHSAVQHWQGRGGQWKGRAQDAAAHRISS